MILHIKTKIKKETNLKYYRELLKSLFKSRNFLHFKHRQLLSSTLSLPIVFVIRDF